MRQLWSRIRDFVVLALFIILSLVVMIRQNEPVFRVLRAFSLEAVSRVENRFSIVGRYVSALQENDALRATNVSLSGQLALLRRAEAENQRLKALIGMRDSLNLPTIAVRVLDRDITRQKNEMTIDAGRRAGVKPGMPVIDDRGILGKVVFTSERFSRVQTYLNTDFRVPVEIIPADAFGIVRWEGRGRFPNLLLMDYVVKTVPVERGQRVVTAASLSFPPGLTVGFIDTVIVQPGQNELKVYLRPGADLGVARYAFVLDVVPDSQLVRVSTSPE